MLRAATLGAIDFSQFDPWDSWSWQRLHLIIDELANQNNQVAYGAHHRHHLALVSHSRLSEESWENSKAAANESLTNLLQSLYPWRAKEIGEVGTKSSRDHAVSQFHEIFGKPGEPQYDQMVAELASYFAKGKLSQHEKELERQKRRAKQQATG
jgi:hypothetical protein